MTKLPDLLPAPANKPGKLKEAKWLSGEGAGSWFLIHNEDKARGIFIVARFSSEGHYECGGYYKAKKPFNSMTDYDLTYPCHCMTITVEQENEIVSFELIKKMSEKEFVKMQKAYGIEGVFGARENINPQSN